MSTPGTVNFPTNLDDTTSLIQAANNAATTLTMGVNGIVTSLPVGSTSLFPTSGAITIDGEIIYYTSTDATDFLGCTRGVNNGGTGSSHSSSASVQMLIVAQHHTTLVGALIAVETKLGSGSSTPTVTNSVLQTTGSGTSGWSSGALALGGFTLTVPATGTAALKSGIAGGQTIYGGTASGDDLILGSTSNSTKGFIEFGNSGYDEANNRLGVGLLTSGAVSSTKARLVVQGNGQFGSSPTTTSSPMPVNYLAVASTTSGDSCGFWAEINDGTYNPRGWLQLTEVFGGPAILNLGTAYSNGGVSITLASAGVEALRMTQDANIGIGTTTPSAKFHVNGGQAIKRTSVSNTNYTVLTSDYLVAYTTLTAARTVTLPAPSSLTAGQVYIIKDCAGTAGANNITVTPATGSIDGGANVVINSNYGFVLVFHDGTNYFTF